MLFIAYGRIGVTFVYNSVLKKADNMGWRSATHTKLGGRKLACGLTREVGVVVCH